MLTIARREQEGQKRDFSAHSERKPMSSREQAEYLVSSFPNVGSNLAKELLAKFGSVKNVVNASLDDLQNVDGVGPKKAENIKQVTDVDYNQRSQSS